MNDRVALRERYLRDPLSIRLGGLAANLARIKSFSDHPDHKDAVGHLLDESKWFIEWTAGDAAPEVQAALADCQVQLARWSISWDRIWDDSRERGRVAEQAGLWSQNLLEISGLLLDRKPAPPHES